MLSQLLHANPPSQHPSESNIKHLPVKIGWCGTGLPSYIDKQEACLVINDIFKTYGFALKKDYKIKMNNIECILSGFDNKNKVGYIYGGHHSLDEDALQVWSHPKNRKKIKGFWLSVDLLSTYLSKEYAGELKKAESIKDEQKQQEFLWDLVEKHTKKKSKRALSLKEAKFLSELYKTENIFILFISRFDSRFTYSEEVDELLVLIDKRLKEVKSKFDQSKLPEDKQSYTVEIEDLEEYKKRLGTRTKTAALKNIEENVQNALDWLKKERDKKSNQKDLLNPPPSGK